jgi:hypothetical protein
MRPPRAKPRSLAAMPARAAPPRGEGPPQAAAPTMAGVLLLLLLAALALSPAAATAAWEQLEEPPPKDCPKCCFELIGDSGCPGSFDCNDCPMGLDSFVNVRRDFGAVGNNGADDTEAIQKAINFAKKTQRGLLFPSGTYVVHSPLDFGAWKGILVTGGVPGASGIAGSGATVQLVAQLNKTEGACFDFSGSAYGLVSGIAFGGTNCQVTVLNARTCCQSKQDQNRSTGSIYGSDITYERCNFGGGSVAAFANHMGEVGASL